MNKKSIFILTIIISLLVVLFSLLLYLKTNNSLSKEEIEFKNIFVKASSLPDLSINNENMSLRHRSLSDIFSIFNESYELKEHQISTFTYSHSTLHLNKQNNRNENDEK